MLHLSLLTPTPLSKKGDSEKEPGSTSTTLVWFLTILEHKIDQ